MLTCEALLDQLMDQDVGDLPEADQVHARAHLEGCPRCAAFVRSLHAVTPMVRHALELSVDDALQAELDAAVMAALRRGA